jgi:hypothetical protein
MEVHTTTDGHGHLLGDLMHKMSLSQVNVEPEVPASSHHNPDKGHYVRSVHQPPPYAGDDEALERANAFQTRLAGLSSLHYGRDGQCA